MPEKDQKSLTVGDILDQLVKPTVVQGPASLSPKPDRRSSQAAPVPERKPVNTEVKLPELGGKPEASLPSLGASGGVGVPEQRLLVRTMATDIAMLRKGSKPASVELKTRQVTAVPKKEKPAPPPPEEKPQLPKISQPPTLPPPPSVKPYPGVGPMKLPEGLHIKEEVHVPHDDEDMLPPFPGAPVPKKVAHPQEEKVEYGVIARIVSSGMTTGIISTIVVAILAYVLLSFFFFGDSQVAGPAPTAQPSVTPVQQVNELETIFGIFPAVSFVLSEGSGGIADLHSFAGEQAVDNKGFKRFNLISETQEKMGFLEILDKLKISYPGQLQDLIGNNYIVLIYGQEEVFEDIGQPPVKRLVLITEIRDDAAARIILRNWEVTMAVDLAGLFGVDPLKQATREFLDNDRRGVQIRYKNFPLPDKSVDYAIVRSLSGKNYLILSNSREAMFSPADKIRGLQN